MPSMPVSPLVLIDELAELDRVAERATDLRHETPGLAALREVDRVWVCGCGDSYHAALAMRADGERISGKAWSAMPAREASLRLASLNDAGRLAVVAISASGKTPATLDALARAKAAGALTLALVNRDASPLAAAADSALVLPIEDRPHAPRIAPFVANAMALAVVAHAAGGNGAACAATLDAMRASIAPAGDLAGVRASFDTWLRPHVGRIVNTAWLGSGPGYGSALFGSAKTIECGGFFSAADDLEEWTHVHRFAVSDAVLTIVDAGPEEGAVRAQAVAALLAALGTPYLVIDHATAPVAGTDGPVIHTGAAKSGFTQLASAVVGAALAALLADAAGRSAGRTASSAFWEAHTAEMKRLLKSEGYIKPAP